MLNNVKDFDAKGDGIADDRKDIQRAIDDAINTGKAGIFFPAGVYRVSHADPETKRWSLDLNGVQDFVIMGEGPKSVVKLEDNTKPNLPNWHVFILRNNCRRVVFKDLVIDGNRTGLTNPDEQSHGIEVEPGMEDLVIDRCILRECFGDGMRLLGSPDQNVKRLRIENSLFQKNKRSGLAIQRALDQIIITNCIFDATVTDQCIDFEPSGHDAPTELIIQGCIMNHTNNTPAVTLSGISGHDKLFNCKFADNIVIGGNIFCTDVRQLAIQNNIIFVTSIGTSQRIPIEVQRGGDSVIISGNLLVNDDLATKAVISLNEVNRRQVSRALVTNNLCFARAGSGIQCLSSDDVAIQGNMIVATDTCVQGIIVRSQSSDVDGISVRDNDITVRDVGKWTSGIRFAATAPNQIREASIIGNSVRGASKGIVFEDTGFEGSPVCALNRIAEDVETPLVGMDQPRTIVVGGATSRGGKLEGQGTGRFLVGVENPENNVTGNVGDIYQWVNGTVDATLFVKEEYDDDNPKSGWKAK
jgi:hypothetical protein